MTIIIALKDEENNKIYLGADRQGTAGDMSYENFGCKLLKIEIPLSDGSIDTIHLAFSGSAFLHQYLLNVFQPPVFDVETNFMNYLYRFFFKDLKEELLENHLIKKDKESLDSDAGLILIHGEDIYNIWHDLSITESPRGYAINGSGYDIGVAVIENNLYFHSDMDYKEIIKEALYTTGRMNIYCNTDCDILTIDY